MSPPAPAKLEPGAARIRRASEAAGLFVAALGFVVLIGWAFDVLAIKTVVPGLAAMKANVAFCFLACGTSLVLWHRSDRAPWALHTSRFSALLAFAVATLTIVEYAIGADLGIDQLLLDDVTSPASGFAPGRMALNSALALVLGTGGLLLLNRESDRRSKLPSTLGIVAALVGILALVGYAVGLHALTAVGPYASTALHTAIGLVALGLGIALARPSKQTVWRLTGRTPGGQLLNWMLPAVIIVPMVFGALHGFLEQSGVVEFTTASWIRSGGVTLLLIVVALVAARRLDAIEAKRLRSQELTK
ncbi:MAG: hypothetical protein H0U42_09300, partial [Thermoleophilaceae bacterium]|nr:hypothetical protein [Thermoleophilaceae bacterium]